MKTAKIVEKTILIGLATAKKSKSETEIHLKELDFLARSAGVFPQKHFIQRLSKPNSTTFVGSGMLNEIKEYMTSHQVSIAIFDDELTPTQMRNIENILAGRVLDRTNLILDIFATRARSAHARLQVELAQYQYLLPRLTRLWTHLERQRGGIGLRGPGEREIETDRRVIRDKIARLKKQLVRVDRQKSTQRRGRGKLVRVALVGYTNAGKSTLLNLLSNSRVKVEDQLFATLDTTVRRMVIENLLFLLSDTVGFIHKLPHCLIESFKATLDEVREADLLVHVIDISASNYTHQLEVVNQTLAEIGADNKPVIEVFNKIDKLTQEIPEREIAGNDTSQAILISALEKTNLDELRSRIYREVKKIHIQRYPYTDFLY